MNIKTNDQLMSIYVSSLIRAITAFHDLIENKIQNRQQQEDKEAKKEEPKEDKNGSGKNNNEDKKTNSSDNGESKDEQEGAKDKGSKKGWRRRSSLAPCVLYLPFLLSPLFSSLRLIWGWNLWPIM